jgi:glycerol uptake facilitator-like aquaporin
VKTSLSRRVAAELVGTAFLVAAVIGSGIMAERLSNGNVALALLANTIATDSALVALLLAFGPISGAHFNPAVTLADTVEGGLRSAEGAAYIAAQVLGGLCGTIAAHWMFGFPQCLCPIAFAAAERSSRANSWRLSVCFP